MKEGDLPSNYYKQSPMLTFNNYEYAILVWEVVSRKGIKVNAMITSEECSYA